MARDRRRFLAHLGLTGLTALLAPSEALACRWRRRVMCCVPAPWPYPTLAAPSLACGMTPQVVPPPATVYDGLPKVTPCIFSSSNTTSLTPTTTFKVPSTGNPVSLYGTNISKDTNASHYSITVRDTNNAGLTLSATPQSVTANCHNGLDCLNIQLSASGAFTNSTGNLDFTVTCSGCAPGVPWSNIPMKWST